MFSYINLINKLEYFILSKYKLSLVLSKSNFCFIRLYTNFKLKLIAESALSVPAYLDLLNISNYTTEHIFFNMFPVTNKLNYISKYPLSLRCLNGKLPLGGNIDESSGSSGHPTTWIHSYYENKKVLSSISFGFHYYLPTLNNTIVLSAWSSGPWATGIKFSQLVSKFSLVKSCNSNLTNVINSFNEFGDTYHYVLSGYPLFIESLLSSDFDFSNYNILILTGGDGYSPLWPLKIKKKLSNPDAIITSSYGCSDVDIGIGIGTPFVEDLRIELLNNSKLKELLFPHNETIPMIFQYNPLLYYIENLADGTFAITSLDITVVSPKIRYCVGDLGGVYTSKEVFNLVKKYAPSLFKKHKESKKLLHLPFLYVYGRADGTISLDGANIFPDSLDIIFTKYFPDVITKFKLKRDEKLNHPFNVIIELNKGLKPSKKLTGSIQNIIKLKLPQLNKDYAESLTSNSNLVPVVILKKYGDSYFKSKKIKYSYIDK